MTMSSYSIRTRNWTQVKQGRILAYNSRFSILLVSKKISVMESLLSRLRIWAAHMTDDQGIFFFS